MGNETRKCFERRLSRGDFERYLRGRGLDIGCGADPLRTPQGKVDAWDLPQGDAETLEGVPDGAYDFVYSSHCLEHMDSVESALANWIRVLKPGGVLYVVVPDYTLYEKESFPSRFNGDHKQTFSLHLPRSTAGRDTHWNVRRDLEPLLHSLGVRLERTALEDDHYDYDLGPEVDQTHFPETLAQICLVGRKEEGEAGKAPLSLEPFRIYTGILGQIGDIVMFTPTARRLRELFPNAEITFAVGKRYREAGELLEGLSYIDRVFVAEQYFDRHPSTLHGLWHQGLPIDFRGDDELAEERRHHLVFETRPRSKQRAWWRYRHQVEETAHRLGIPGPIDLQTDVAIPPGIRIPGEFRYKIVLHNDPSIDSTKAWPWEHVRRFAELVGPSHLVLVGGPGPAVEGSIDLRGRLRLAETAELIAGASCYVGIDSGPMWIAASLRAPVVGLYGTSYIPAYEAIWPRNPKATYLQVEGTLDGIAPERAWQACQAILKSPQGASL